MANEIESLAICLTREQNCGISNTMRKTLVLSATFDPISFIGYKNVMSLVRRDVVEILSVWEDEELYKERFLPSVVRLKGFRIRQKTLEKQKVAHFNRSVMFVRDLYRCVYCDARLDYKSATVDHVLPRHHGGVTSWENCVTACFSCNSKKSDSLLAKSGLVLRRKPTIPNSRHFWAAKLHGSMPPPQDWHTDWSFYIKEV